MLFTALKGGKAVLFFSLFCQAYAMILLPHKIITSSSSSSLTSWKRLWHHNCRLYCMAVSQNLSEKITKRWALTIYSRNPSMPCRLASLDPEGKEVRIRRRFRFSSNDRTWQKPNKIHGFQSNPFPFNSIPLYLYCTFNNRHCHEAALKKSRCRFKFRFIMSKPSDNDEEKLPGDDMSKKPWEEPDLTRPLLGDAR